MKEVTIKEVSIKDKNALSLFVDSNNHCWKITELSRSANCIDTLENKKLERMRQQLVKKMEEAAEIAEQLSSVYYNASTVYADGSKCDKYNRWS